MSKRRLQKARTLGCQPCNLMRFRILISFLANPDSECLLAKQNHCLIVNNFHIFALRIYPRWTFFQPIHVGDCHLIYVYVSLVDAWQLRARFKNTGFFRSRTPRSTCKVCLGRLNSGCHLIQFSLVEISQVANRAQSCGFLLRFT